MISNHRQHGFAWPTKHRLSALLFALSLAYPGIVNSLGIGEVSLESHLGEPVVARIPLILTTGETVEETCLSLSEPEANQRTQDIYLTQAKLSLVPGTSTPQVLVRGSQPMNSAFIRMILQVRCPGQGSVSRGFTLLPGIDISLHPDLPAEAALIQSPETAAPTVSTAISGDAAGTSSTPSRRRSQPSIRAANDPNAPPPAAVKKSYRSGEFVLRLSSDVVEAAAPPAAEKSDNTAASHAVSQDDQTAHILALQHQVKQLQDELNDLRQGMAASAPVAAPRPTHQAAVPQPIAPAVTDDTELTSTLAYAALAILALTLGLLGYKRRKQVPVNPDAVVEIEPLEETIVATPAPGIAATATETASLAPAQTGAPDTTPEASSLPAAGQSVAANESQESDWVIEEAELYAVHGHPELAIQILEKLLEQSPNKPQAWLLLLSILSSLERRSDFETTARRFAETGQSRALWKEVQALGQRIDKDNPLYFGEVQELHEPIPLHRSNRRPLGAILLDTGALTEEVLMGVLSQFNPKRDGRIGGYLIKHGLINEAQLEAALDIQRHENTD